MDGPMDGHPDGRTKCVVESRSLRQKKKMILFHLGEKSSIMIFVRLLFSITYQHHGILNKPKTGQKSRTGGQGQYNSTKKNNTEVHT